MPQDVKKRGFTLLEVLLTIVLIGSVWVIFAVNMGTLLDKDSITELESAFVLAQTEGRMLALEKRQSLEMIWNAKESQFVLMDQAIVSSYAIEGIDPEQFKLKATFFMQEPTYKGESFEDPSWYEVESVILYSDATSAPFKVVLEDGLRTRELIIEPFTGFVRKSS
jgi:prepilin-type N-terminal cleavage/methylation domain-containing protein